MVVVLKTRITELLGVKYPIIQGGMAWVAEAKLAAAVSNAGGVGLIAGGNAPAEVIREEIRKAKEMTDKPFGVGTACLRGKAGGCNDRSRKPRQICRKF